MLKEHQVDENVYEIGLEYFTQYDESGKVTKAGKTFEAKETPETVGVLVQKTDSESGNVVKGAGFAVFKDAACTQRVLMNGDAGAEVPVFYYDEDLDGAASEKFVKQQDVYYVKEVVVPDGYRDDGKVWETKLNNNMLIIGGSGAGKTFYEVKPNLMQMNSSFIITDPKGEILRSTGAMLKANGYNVKVINLLEMDKSDCYNPFSYIREETFQFQVTGTKLEVEKWKVSTESGLVISDDGLLTTVWGPGYSTPYLTSTVTAILENNQRLTATVRVYAESNFYVDKVLTAFEQKYITSSMTGKEKVERAAAYIGETTDYQVNQNNWQMLLLGGKGDCLASRVLLAYMCKHMGIKAEPCGEFEYHGETLVKADGTYYIVITGFDEPRPRRYVITEITDQSQLQKIMDDNNLSTAMFD